MIKPNTIQLQIRESLLVTSDRKRDNVVMYRKDVFNKGKDEGKGGEWTRPTTANEGSWYKTDNDG
jgi:hypothetical protein